MFCALFVLCALRLPTRSRRRQSRLFNQIWDVIVELLVREGQFRLLYRRHVDILMMCSIYAVCKVMADSEHTKITFREILTHYRMQPQCHNNETVRNSISADIRPRTVDHSRAPFARPFPPRRFPPAHFLLLAS